MKKILITFPAAIPQKQRGRRIVPIYTHKLEFINDLNDEHTGRSALVPLLITAPCYHYTRNTGDMRVRV